MELWISLTVIALLSAALLFLARGKPPAPEEGTRSHEAREEMVATIARLQEQTRMQQDEIAALKSAEQRLHEENRDLTARVERLDAELKSERQRGEEKLTLLRQAEAQLTQQFKVLASDILEQNGKRLVAQQRESLGSVIDPLREQIDGFRKKVEETYEQEARERHSLKDQIELLRQSNARISEEADNLVAALKGNAKARGNWGEMMLEKVLESSGLIKGVNYQTQVTTHNDEGKRLLPDVVVNLPENRHIVIDAKVSLIAYDRYVAAEDETARIRALDEHVAAMNQHIKELSGKEYQRYGTGEQLDFVLMFVPVEPAFMAATIHDPTLFQRAWAKNIVIVSPSTLLAMLRTIATIWRQEEQQRNAEQIAQRGAELYRKLHGFVTDLERVGVKLEEATRAYDSAHKRLATGRGNVIRQAEMLKELGVAPGKSLPEALVEQAIASEEAETASAITEPTGEQKPN